MRKPSLPTTDSIEKLAKFWDTHDLTEFEGELEEAVKPVFERATGTALRIDLQPAEAQQLKRIARSKRVKETTVARQWIQERLHEYSHGEASHRSRQRLVRP